MSITRDEARRIIRRSIPLSTTPTLKKTIIDGVVDLNKATIGGQMIDISPQSVLRLDSSPGQATPGKALTLDQDKSVTGVNSISMDALYVDGRRIVIPEGVQVSTSTLLRNIPTGVSLPGKALTTRSDKSARVDTLEANTITTSKTLNTFKYRHMSSLNKSIKFDQTISYGITLPSIFGHFVRLNDITYLAEHQGTDVAPVSPTTVTFGTTLTTLQTETIFPSNRISPINEMTLIHVPQLNMYLAVILRKLTASSYEVVLYKGQTLTTMTSQTIQTISGAMGNENVKSPNIIWSPALSTLVIVTTSGAACTIFRSTDANTWLSLTITSLGTASTAVFTIAYKENPTPVFYLVEFNSRVTIRTSSDLINWTVIYNSLKGIIDRVTPVTPAVIKYDSIVDVFYIGNSSNLGVFTKDMIVFNRIYCTTNTSINSSICGVPYIVGDSVYLMSALCSVKIDRETNQLRKLLPGVMIAYHDGEYRLCRRNTTSITLFEELEDQPEVDIINYVPEQFLDIEPIYSEGLYDFVFDESRQLYYVVGSMENNYASRNPNSYLYVSKDLTSFTPISNVGIAANKITIGGLNGDIIVVYISRANAVRYSTDGGYTWSVVGGTLPLAVIDIVFLNACNYWLIMGIDSASTVGLSTLGSSPTSVTVLNQSGRASFSEAYFVGSVTQFSTNAFVSRNLLNVFLGNISVPSMGITASPNFTNSNFTLTNTASAGDVYGIGDISSIPGEPCFIGLTGTGTTTILLTHRRCDTFSSNSPRSTAGPWLAPYYIEPLNLLVATKSLGTSDTYSIMWSTSGVQWNIIENFRFNLTTTANTPFKYDHRSGYLYVLTPDNTYRTKHSLLKHIVRVEHVPRSLFQGRNSVTLKEIRSYESFSLFSGQPISSGFAGGIGWVVTSTNIHWSEHVYSMQSASSDGVVSLDRGLVSNSVAWVGVGNGKISHGSTINNIATDVTTSGAWKSVKYFMPAASKHVWALCGDNVLGIWDGSALTETPAPGMWTSVKIVNDTAIALSSGKIAVMANSSGWTVVNTIAQTWKDIAYGCGRWVLLGDTNTYTGKTFSNLTLVNTLENYRSIAFINDIQQFVLVGNNSVAYYANGLNKSMKDGVRTVTFNGNWRQVHWAYRLGCVALVGDSKLALSNPISAGIDVGIVLPFEGKNSLTRSSTLAGFSLGTTTLDNSNLRIDALTGASVLKLRNTTDNTVLTIDTIVAAGTPVTGHTFADSKLDLDAENIISENFSASISGKDIFPAIQLPPTDAPVVTDHTGGLELHGAVSSKGIFINGELYSQNLPPASTPGVAEPNKVCVAGSTSNLSGINTVEVEKSIQIGSYVYDTLPDGEHLIKKPKVYINNSGFSGPSTNKFIAYSSIGNMYYCVSNSANAVDHLTVATSPDLFRWTRLNLGIRGTIAFTSDGFSISNGTNNVLANNVVVPYAMLYTNSEISTNRLLDLNSRTSSNNSTILPTSGIESHYVSFRVSSNSVTSTIPFYISIFSPIANKYYLSSSLQRVSSTSDSRLSDSTSKFGLAFIGNSGGYTVFIVYNNSAILACTMISGGSASVGNSVTPGGTIFDMSVMSISPSTHVVVFSASSGRVLVSQIMASSPSDSITLTTVQLPTTLDLTKITINPVINRLLVCAPGRLYVSNANSTSVWNQIDTNIMPISAIARCTSVGPNGWTISFSDIRLSGMLLVVTPTSCKVSIVDPNVVSGRGVYAFGSYHIPINQVYPCRTLSSRDGCIWSPGFNLPSTFTSSEVYAESMVSPWICYSAGLDTMIIPCGMNIFYTTDGINYNLAYTVSSGSSIADCVWAPSFGKFIAVVNGALTGNILTSEDGIIWTAHTISNAINLALIQYSPTLERVLVVAGERTVFGLAHGAYSDDGVNWVTPNISLPGEIAILGGSYLSYCHTRDCFVLSTISQNGSLRFSISSRDGIQWDYFRVYNGRTNAAIWVLRPISQVLNLPGEPGVSDIFLTRGSSTDVIGTDPGDLFVIREKYARVYTSIGSRSGGVNDFAHIINSSELNRIVVYKDSASNPMEYSAVIDVDSGMYPPYSLSTDVLSNYATPTPSDVFSWKSHTISGFSFTGKIRWSDGNHAMIAVSGNIPLTAGNQYMVSETGFRWYKASADSTNVPNNTLVYDISQEPIGTRLVFGQSNGCILSNELPTTSDDTVSSLGAMTVSRTGTTATRTFYSHKHEGIIACTSSGTATFMGSALNPPVGISFPTISVGCAISAPEIDVLAVFPTSGNTYFYYTTEWVSGTMPVSGNFVEAAYSPSLMIIVVVTSNGNACYSYDGETWQSVSTSKPFTDLIWVSDLQLFVASINDESSIPIAYSSDGVTWNYATTPTSVSAFGIGWNPFVGSLFLACGNIILTSSPVVVRPGNVIDRFKFQIQDGATGLHVGNDTSFAVNLTNYQLTLTTDSTFKPTTNSWTVASDSRIKESIVAADVDRCYDIVKNIPLKRYKWREEFVEKYSIKDAHKLGWISQDVESVFPNSVTIGSEFDISDFKNLNTDQLIASLWGAIQSAHRRLKKIDEALES